MSDDKLSIPVRIRSLDGTTTRINTQPNWTVFRLKQELAKWKGEGWEKVNLHYRAKRLNNDDLLSKCNIVPDGYIMVHIRSNGGRMELEMIFRIGIVSHYWLLLFRSAQMISGMDYLPKDLE